MRLSVFFLEFILYGTLHFLYLGDCFPMLGKFSTSNIFSGPFPFSSSGTSVMQMLVCLMLSQRSLRLSSLFSPLTFFSFFFLYIVLSQWFPPLWLSIHFFFLMPQLFCYWFLLVYFSFQSSCCSSLFFKSSLLNISGIFLISASILFSETLDSPLSLLWTLFQVDCLSSLHLVVLLGFLKSCSLVCSIFLCHLILSKFLGCGLLSAGCGIIVPLILVSAPWWVSLDQEFV